MIEPKELINFIAEFNEILINQFNNEKVFVLANLLNEITDFILDEKSISMGSAFRKTRSIILLSVQIKYPGMPPRVLEKIEKVHFVDLKFWNEPNLTMSYSNYLLTKEKLLMTLICLNKLLKLLPDDIICEMLDNDSIGWGE